MEEAEIIQYAPIALMFLVAAGFVGVTMLATHVLGPRRNTKTKLDSFECGIESRGNARLPFNIKYFLFGPLDGGGSWRIRRRDSVRCDRLLSATPGGASP